MLNFLAQQSFLLKEISEGNKLYDRLLRVNENEQITMKSIISSEKTLIHLPELIKKN